MLKINCFDGDKMMSANKKPPDGYKEGPLPVISGESKSIFKRKLKMRKYGMKKMIFWFLTAGETRNTLLVYSLIH